jgi:hypothetical protein
MECSVRVLGRLCTLLGVLLCAGCVHGFAAQPAGLQRGGSFAAACRWRMAAATQPSKTEKELEPRMFLRTLLSSRTPQAEKTQLMDAARQLRGKSQDEYIAFLDSLLTEVDSVSDNSWAMRRWAIPLPSYRLVRVRASHCNETSFGLCVCSRVKILTCCSGPVTMAGRSSAP